MTIGERLKSERVAAKLTQGQLAELSGISQQMISKLERNAASATREILALAAALSISPDWLKDGTGPKQIDKDAPEDREFFRDYHALPVAFRKAVRNMVRDMRMGQSTGEIRQ